MLYFIGHLPPSVKCLIFKYLFQAANLLGNLFPCFINSLLDQVQVWCKLLLLVVSLLLNLAAMKLALAEVLFVLQRNIFGCSQTMFLEDSDFQLLKHWALTAL